MQQEIFQSSPEISSFQLQPRITRKKIRRLVNNKKVTFYVCQDCDSQFDRQARLIQHIKKKHPSQNFNQIEINAPENREIQNNLQEYYLNEQQNQQQSLIENRLSALEKKVQNFEQIGNKPPIIAARKVVQQNQQIFLALLTKKLTIQFSKNQKNICEQNEINQISLGMISILSQIDLSKLFLNPKKVLKEAHQCIIKQLQSKRVVKRTIYRADAAYRFFSNLPFHQLQSQFGILECFQSLSITQKKQYSAYYKKLLKYIPKNYQLNDLPHSLSILHGFAPFKRQILSINSVKQEIQNLWLRQQKELCCDLYFILVTGLRKSETLRISLLDKQQKFVQFLQIFQQKNRHTTTRWIPHTLFKLIQLTGNTFPISIRRFTNARNHSLRVFKQFYGLRHCYLTTIFNTFYTSSQLNFHHKSQTSFSRYIDTELKNTCERAFSLKIDYEIKTPMSNKKLVFSQSLVYEEEIGKGTEQFILHYDNQQRLDILVDDQVITNTFQIPNQGVSRQENQKFQSIAIKNKVFSKFQQQFKVIGKIENIGLIQMIYALIKQEEIPQFFNYLQSKAQISNLSSIFQHIKHYFQKSVLFLKTSEDVNNFSSTNFGLLKQNDQLSVTEVEISRKDIKPHKKNFLKISKRKGEFLNTHMTLKCSCGLYRTPKLFPDQQQWIFQCRKRACEDYISHYVQPNFQNIKQRQKVKIIPIDPKNRSVKEVYSIKRIQKKNNLQQQIAGYGGSYSKYNVYDQQIPSQIFVEAIPIFSKVTNEQVYIIYSQIILNRQAQFYLPLQIKPSKVISSGLGMFSTKKISAGSIIITYSGFICGHSKITGQDDSLFQLGNLSNRQLLFIYPKKYLNGARFINGIFYGGQQVPQNAKSILGIHQYQPNCFEILVYVQSLKDILPGEEIFYQYGSTYSK